MSSILEYGRAMVERARSLPLVVDAAIVVACITWSAIYVVLSSQPAWLFLVAVLHPLPLLWRRRYPLAVLSLTGVGTTWLALGGALGDVPITQLVATYTLAALSPPIRRLLGALATVAGVTVSILVPRDPVIALGLAGIMFVVAYALGTSSRARRDRIAMLDERARRHAEERDAATTRERERIAREMHDILAHSMSLVVVQAEAGPVVVRSDPTRAEQVFDTISETAREALVQLRRALGVLRADGAGAPARAPQPGLSALPPLVAGVRATGLAATLEEHGQARPVPADLAATAYRIVQESLTNTLKHAGASTALVRLEWRDGTLRLAVCDDGRGTTSNGSAVGHGLVGMRERVAAAGGELTTGPGPEGVGFQVTATLPLP